ncbi:XdhC family protein [Psychromonas sp. KJ10-10]|uniref:XdhC family protein n=1 Tax=Psychromonas sp. KJ10-10 TaxID=3391823 RepID=UPI0039B50EF7
MNTSLPKVVVFGAGHVCHSLTTILKALPCHLKVIDSRKDWLQSIEQLGVCTSYYETPHEAIADISADSHLIIMTHEHSQDFEITRIALERKCFPFIGLIASKSKKQRFEFRLKEQLSKSQLVNDLTCPVGDPNIKGKLPMQVAVSISAQLMALFEQQKVQNIQSKQQHKMQWDNANHLRTTLMTKQNSPITMSS